MGDAERHAWRETVAGHAWRLCVAWLCMIGASPLAVAQSTTTTEPAHHHHRAAETEHAKLRPPHRHAEAAKVADHRHHAAPLRHVAPPPARPVLPPAPIAPAAPPPPMLGSVTGLKIPRFASLRSEEVNLRSGPGTRYPIEWVYKRRDLPVEIEREFDVWRLVVDQDGTQGWVHQATLIGTRTFTVVAPAAAAAPAPAATDAAGTDPAAAALQVLRRTADAAAPPVAYLKPGVIGRILTCDAGSDWCHVSVRGLTGYLPRRALWGVLPGEVVGAS